MARGRAPLAPGVVRAWGWESADTDLPCPVQHRTAVLLSPSRQPPRPPLLLHTPRSSRQFQECLPSRPVTFCRAMWTLPLAVPGPGAQGQKTKSSWLAPDSASLGTCPSRPSRWPQRPRELRAGKEEAWRRDLACPAVASRDPAIFLWTLPPESPAPVRAALALHPSPSQRCY